MIAEIRQSRNCHILENVQETWLKQTDISKKMGNFWKKQNNKTHRDLEV